MPDVALSGSWPQEVSGIASTVLYIVASLVNGLNRAVGFMIIDLFISWNFISPIFLQIGGSSQPCDLGLA